MASQLPDDQPRPVTPPSYRPGMDAGGLIARVKSLVVDPKAEWPRIDAAPMTEQGIYTGIVAPLAAIPVIAKLIGSLVFPAHAFGVVFRPSIAGAVAGAIVSYAMAFVSVFLMAAIVAALAPSFAGRNDRTQATKLVAFTSAVVWAAGVTYVVPALGGLVSLVAALYTIYLLYLGLPVLMKSPPDRSVSYIVVTVVLAIVIFLGVATVAGMLTALFMPTPTFGTVTVS